MKIKIPGGSRNGVNTFLSIYIFQFPLQQPTIDLIREFSGFKDEFQENAPF
jgi:hypothetical protein